MTGQPLAIATPHNAVDLPDDVAAAALFLASDGAAPINGHDPVVDGGMTVGGRVDYSQA